MKQYYLRGEGRMQEAKKTSLGSKLLKRYGLDALGAMALGLFSTLIIGTILDQLGTYVPGLQDSAISRLSPNKAQSSAPRSAYPSPGV